MRSRAPTRGTPRSAYKGSVKLKGKGKKPPEGLSVRSEVKNQNLVVSKAPQAQGGFFSLRNVQSSG